MSNKDEDSFIITYCLSAIASALAETATFPLDITKTRLQIQGSAEGSVAVRRGLFSTAIGIAKEEGFLNLYRGLTPACLRHVVYSGIRVTAYQYIREEIFQMTDDADFVVWKAIISGGTAGAIGQFFANPTDLVKVRMQIEGQLIARGEPPRYRGTIHAFKTIFSEGGMRGLWKGWVPNCQRAMFVQIGDLAFYDITKRTVLQYTDIGDNPRCHTISSLAASIAAAAFGTPADVIKTRMMNQEYGSDGRGLVYKSSTQCLKMCVQQEGVLALWKGVLPCWLRMAPWNWVFWVSMEKLRRVTGQSSW